MSIKQPEQKVFYVDKDNDRSRWAVSTAAHWQKRGHSPPSYWTCTTNLQMQDDLSKGGVLICVEHYGIWLAFDNLKVAEPSPC